MEINLIFMTLSYALFLGLRAMIPEKIIVPTVSIIISISGAFSFFSLNDLTRFGELPFKVNTLFFAFLIIFFESILYSFRRYKLSPGVIFFILITLVSTTLESLSLMSFCLAMAMIGLILEEYGHTLLTVLCAFFLIARDQFSDVIAFLYFDMISTSIFMLGVLAVFINLKNIESEDEEYLVSKILFIAILAQIFLMHKDLLELRDMMYYFPTVILSLVCYKSIFGLSEDKILPRLSSILMVVVSMLLLFIDARALSVIFLLDLILRVNPIELHYGKTNLGSSLLKLSLSLLIFYSLFVMLKLDFYPWIQLHYLIFSLLILLTLNRLSLRVLLKKRLRGALE